MTYEKQGEVRTVGLRDGIHKNFLLTSNRQYTALCEYVNRNIRGCSRLMLRRYLGNTTEAPRLMNCWQSRSRCLVSQFDVPVDRHSGLATDTRLDDIDLIARLQEFPGLLFDRL
jgi:hypothetical protein